MRVFLQRTPPLADIQLDILALQTSKLQERCINLAKKANHQHIERTIQNFFLRISSQLISSAQINGVIQNLNQTLSNSEQSPFRIDTTKPNWALSFLREKSFPVSCRRIQINTFTRKFSNQLENLFKDTATYNIASTALNDIYRGYYSNQTTEITPTEELTIIERVLSKITCSIEPEQIRQNIHAQI